jgi:ubiquitin-conjugating enzyme E2 J1
MSPTTKRLLREAQELSPCSPTPSPFFHAAPLSDSNLFEWHFTLVGPPSSPYANGIYHGRIVLPPQYPLRPPSFRFLTPSGRFEVNREICLSISGHHEETWQPAWGIRTALTAIRAFMSGSAQGQVGGLEAGEERRKDLAVRSRSWRCQGCGGKTNEEILKQWAVDVLEAGGSFKEKEEEGDALPEGLKLAYKDEMGKDKGGQRLGSTPGVESSSPEKPNDVDLSSAKTIAVPSLSGTTATLPSQEIQILRPTPTIPLPQQQSSPSQPQVQAQVQQQLPARRQVQVQTGDSSNDMPPAWIDRAICVVVIALLIMLCKKYYFPYV